jgi:hypothetical protein
VLEHHSNIVPWQLIAERTGAVVRFVDIDDRGGCDSTSCDGCCRSVRIVAVGHVSNAIGTIHPVAGDRGRLAHDAGALLVVDGAQGAPHLKVDVQALGCDFYALSGHKMCGPMGIGALWGRRELLDAMPPYQGGGEMIDYVGTRRLHRSRRRRTASRRARRTSAAPSAGRGRRLPRRIGHDALCGARAGADALRPGPLAGAMDGVHVFGPRDPPSAPPSSRSRSRACTRTMSRRSSMPRAWPCAPGTTAASRSCAGSACPPPRARRCYLYNTTDEIDRARRRARSARATSSGFALPLSCPPAPVAQCANRRHVHRRRCR